MNTKLINDIDKQISDSLTDLPNVITNLSFSESIEFNIESANEIIDFDSMKFPGLYFFEVKNTQDIQNFTDWSTWFLEKWEYSHYKKSFTPNSRKMRLLANKNSTNLQWIPLYLGKSRNVAKRIHQHINLELKKPTFALKLKSRTNLTDLTFRVSTLKIDVVNYDIIMPNIERALRNKYNPILGKQ